MSLLNYKKNLIAVATLTVLFAAPCAFADTIVNQVMPGHNNNGTWIYDGTYDSSGNKTAVDAGTFLPEITAYNQAAAAANHPNSQINQVITYGGDIELYCAGGEGGQDTNACVYNSFLLSYYPPTVINKKYGAETVANFITNFGDSGFTSVNQYAGLTTTKPNQAAQKVQTIVDIDGRVDMSPGDDYLNELNSMDQADASQFADKIALQVCADDNITGVQFDVEPFSFIGTGGTVKGTGQYYFYQEISKDFAGNYSGTNWPVKSPDPLHCVDPAHPQGRVFSVFTFAKSLTETPQVTQEMQQVFGNGQGSYGNGYIVDSLYDLGTNPGGTYTPPATYIGYVQAEVAAMSTEADKLGIPYQFGIPAAASAHEFESKAGVKTGANQDQYVQAALQAIAIPAVENDPLFKGTDVWAWNSAMWWGGNLYSPSNPTQNAAVMTDLVQHLDGSAYSQQTE